MEQQT